MEVCKQTAEGNLLKKLSKFICQFDDLLKIKIIIFQAGGVAPKHKPLSGLLDEISSMSSSNVTSPNSQSSYNPLLDDNDLANGGAASASSDYAIMSPASSSAGGLPCTRSAGGGGNNVNKHHHPTKLQVGPEEYVDMSPRGAVPIPNILNRNTSEHRIGYSPRTTLLASKTPSSSEADSPYLLMSPGEHNPPDKHKFEISSTRTGSIDSSTGARPKTSRTSSRNYLRSQCDSQRSSLCFEDPLEFGISPQDNSGSTLIGEYII